MNIRNLICLLLTFAGVIPANAALSKYDKNAPVGWASYNYELTGGGNAAPITVTSLSELTDALSGDKAAVIVVKGTIEVPSVKSIKEVSNKTLVGEPGAMLKSTGSIDKTTSGIFNITNCENLIIRNIVFQGPGSHDVDGYDLVCLDKCSHIWIDHCEFIDGLDGNLDIKGATDFVSITWCQFRYTSLSDTYEPRSKVRASDADPTKSHSYSNLIGSSDSATGDRGKLNITFNNCHWGKGCVERMPRVRYGKIHIANCLYNSERSHYCIGGGVEANVRAEHSAFIGVNDPYKSYSKTSAPDIVEFIGCHFDNCTGNTTGSGGSAFIPPYTLSVYDATLVESVVTDSGNGAGATLTSPLTIGEIESGGDGGGDEGGEVIVVSSKTWNFSEWNESGEKSATFTNDGLTIKATSAKPVSFSNASMSIDGFDFTKCLDVKGGGNTEQRCMEFTIPGKSEIILYSNAGDKGRTVNIHDGKEVVHSQSANKIVYTATEAATLYVYSAGSGIQFFQIGYKVLGEAPKSDDATLRQLKVNGTDILLKPDVYTYKYVLDVHEALSSIEAIASHSKASVAPIDLPASLPATVLITVTAENGAQQIYTLSVSQKTDTSIGSVAAAAPSFRDGTLYAPEASHIAVYRPDGTAVVSASTPELSLAPMPGGIYIVRIRYADGRTAVLRLRK